MINRNLTELARKRASLKAEIERLYADEKVETSRQIRLEIRQRRQSLTRELVALAFAADSPRSIRARQAQRRAP